MKISGVAISISVLLSLSFLVLKLIGRHQAHHLSGARYDPWPVLAWFGVDLALLGLGLAISSQVVLQQQFTYEEAAAFFTVLSCLTAVGWLAYAQFIKRYTFSLNSSTNSVWTDFRSCAWIFLSLYAGLFGLGVVVEALMP